jgi:hypothetical protein
MLIRKRIGESLGCASMKKLQLQGQSRSVTEAKLKINIKRVEIEYVDELASYTQSNQFAE